MRVSIPKCKDLHLVMVVLHNSRYEQWLTPENNDSHLQFVDSHLQ